VVFPSSVAGVIVRRAAPPGPPVLRSQLTIPSSALVLAVRVEQRTNARVMSTPASATWVGASLSGRLAVPLVTVLTMAACATAGAIHAPSPSTATSPSARAVRARHTAGALEGVTNPA